MVGECEAGPESAGECVLVPQAAAKRGPVNPPSTRGTITVLIGCMFSGKTTLMLRRMADREPTTIAAFKHAVDDRYAPDEVVAHGGARIAARAVESFEEIDRFLSNGAAGRVHAVAIDEGHFFSRSLVDCVTSLADRGLDVYVTMLDRDCWGRVIPLARKLNHVCDEIVLMHASCGHCGRPASRTQRLTPIVSGNLVGGPNDYEARCLECWRPPPESPPAMG